MILHDILRGLGYRWVSNSPTYKSKLETYFLLENAGSFHHALNGTTSKPETKIYRDDYDSGIESRILCEDEKTIEFLIGDDKWLFTKANSQFYPYNALCRSHLRDLNLIQLGTAINHAHPELRFDWGIAGTERKGSKVIITCIVYNGRKHHIKVSHNIHSDHYMCL